MIVLALDKALLLALTMSNGADLASTELMLNRCASLPTYVCKESNPIMGQSALQHVAVKGVMSALQYQILHGKSKRTKIVAGVMVVLINGWAVKHNFDEIKKLK